MEEELCLKTLVHLFMFKSVEWDRVKMFPLFKENSAYEVCGKMRNTKFMGGYHESRVSSSGIC